MFTFTSFSSFSRSPAILSRIGETAWHGPHHWAQKSTRTGLSLFRTSCSKSDVLTAVAIDSFRRSVACYPPSNGSEPVEIPVPRIEAMFAPLPDKPDHPALEEEVLDWWERERIFARLRERNAGGPHWSFVDGPVTANKTL